MIKRILVALSGTPFTPTAVRHALELAKRHDAHITGVTLIDTEKIERVGPVPVGGGAAAHALREHRMQLTREHVEESIADFERTCGGAGITCCVDREEGEAFDRLLDLWRYHDLTIFGLRGMFEYGVVHNPDDAIIKLLSKGMRPVVAVAQKYAPINRVLVAYNGSMEAAKAMKQFAQMRLWPDAQVRVTCFGYEADESAPLLEDAGTYLKMHGFNVEVEASDGNSKDGLLKYATQWNADLIVMGASGRSKLARMVMGETALQALVHAEIPLFLSH